MSKQSQNFFVGISTIIVRLRHLYERSVLQFYVNYPSPGQDLNQLSPSEEAVEGVEQCSGA